jgi:cytochrome b involved in lipid metabolism
MASGKRVLRDVAALEALVAQGRQYTPEQANLAAAWQEAEYVERTRLAELEEAALLEPRLAYSYSMEKVAQHNTRDDLWVVVDDLVFDLTSFVGEHPGGPTILLEWAGRDASQARIHHPLRIRVCFLSYMYIPIRITSNIVAQLHTSISELVMCSVVAAPWRRVVTVYIYLFVYLFIS